MVKIAHHPRDYSVQVEWPCSAGAERPQSRKPQSTFIVIAMDATLALKGSTLIGSIYAANCYLNKDGYLKDQAMPVTNSSKYLVGGLAGGVVGITVMTGMAAMSTNSEAKVIALTGNVAAFTAWCINAVHKNMVEATDGSKTDLGICAVMLTATGLALLAAKK